MAAAMRVPPIVRHVSASNAPRVPNCLTVWGQGIRDTRSQGHGRDFAMSEASDLVASGYDTFYSMWGQSPTVTAQVSATPGSQT
jgi:hypothetical protein